MDHEKLSGLLQDFLISQREKAGLSQSDIAARSEVYGLGKTLDQRAVSRIEKQPLSADAIKIAGYLTAVGIQPQQYYELLTKLTLKENKEIKMTDIHNIITAKIDAAKLKVKSAKEKLIGGHHEYLDSINLIDRFEKVEELLSGLNRKPVIGCFGHFDAGKSTLLNTLINQSLLPEKYQPATCIVNLLMHTSDRPETISGSIAVFKKGFKPHMIHDQDLVDEFIIEQGDKDILERLGVHNYDEGALNEAYIAIVFSESEVLKKVWLLDTPGDLNGTDDSDTEKALGGVELTDGILFVSNHTGFFKDSDLGFASNIIRQRPPVNKNNPVDHLLFIQSHCHSEINVDAVTSVGTDTFKRINKQLNNMIFKSWQDDGYIEECPSPEDLSSRVQPFWRENNDYRTNTIRRILAMGDFLLENQSEIVDLNIEKATTQLSSIIDSAVETLQKKKEDTLDRVKEVKKQDARFRKTSSDLVGKFRILIGSCKSRKDFDTDSMHSYFKHNTSQEGLVEIIEDTYSDKKDAQSDIGNYISQLLTAKLESTLKSSGKLLSGEVDDLLSKWQEAAPSMSKASIDSDLGDMSIDVSAFNSRAAFVGGLAGLGSLGAMALYVSTIASNLGAYILVGKAAGVLASLGLVGSVTGVTSFVAAIGGPITIGIALAATIGYIIYRIAGGSWQKSLAKKVSDAIKKENVWDNVEKPISDFWETTETAVSSGLNELIVQTDDYIEKLKEDALKVYDSASIDKCITLLKSISLNINERPSSKVA